MSIWNSIWTTLFRFLWYFCYKNYSLRLWRWTKFHVFIGLCTMTIHYLPSLHISPVTHHPVACKFLRRDPTKYCLTLVSSSQTIDALRITFSHLTPHHTSCQDLLPIPNSPPSQKSIVKPIFCCLHVRLIKIRPSSTAPFSNTFRLIFIFGIIILYERKQVSSPATTSNNPPFLVSIIVSIHKITNML